MKLLESLFPAATLILASALVLQADEARQRQHEVMRDALAPDRIAETTEPLLFEDDEFGETLILRRSPPPPLFTVFADGGVGRTSNPLLLPNGSDSDYLFTGALGAVIRPNIVREWEPALSAEFFGQYQIFRYDEMSALDFDSQAIGGKLTYALPRGVNAYGGWTGSRLVDRKERDRFFQESQTTAGLNTIFFQEEGFAAFAGVQADLRNTSPSSLSRLDYGPYTGVQVFLHDNVPVTVRYRFSHQHYLNEARDDLNSWAHLSIGWRISPAFILQTQGNFVLNRSNREENEYNLATIRVGATATFSF